MNFFARLFARTQSRTGQTGAEPAPAAYWSLPPEQLLAALHATANGLDDAEAGQRLKRYGPNELKAQKQATALGLFANQFRSPLMLILIFAAIVSAVVAVLSSEKHSRSGCLSQK